MNLSIISRTCDELIDNHPHLFGRVFACLLFSVGSNGFFFRLVELQFFYQFHTGSLRNIVPDMKVRYAPFVLMKLADEY